VVRGEPAPTLVALAAGPEHSKILLKKKLVKRYHMPQNMKIV
jgi:hypothetical protein